MELQSNRSTIISVVSFVRSWTVHPRSWFVARIWSNHVDTFRIAKPRLSASMRPWYTRASFIKTEQWDSQRIVLVLCPFVSSTLKSSFCLFLSLIFFSIEWEKETEREKVKPIYSISMFLVHNTIFIFICMHIFFLIWIYVLIYTFYV